MHLQQSSQVASFGSFRLDLKAGELHKNDRRIRLHEQPFRVLKLLLERPGEVVSREEIRQRLWPNDTVVEFDNGINAAIKKLRDALGDSADQPRYIETFARRGYRFMLPVEWEPSGDSSAGAVESPEAVHAPRQPARPPAEAAQVPSSPINLSASRIGQRVAHYRVLDVLGGGGMGLVYRAEDIKLGRKVALKFLPEEMAADPVALERFEREARAASALNHPNICTIHEIEEQAGQPFIVMELLEGQTLRDLLEKSKTDVQGSRVDAKPGAGLPLATILDLSTQIAAGLEAAHQQGIIHRDIKPANIFVTRQGQAKILDFGLAKLQGLGARGQGLGSDDEGSEPDDLEPGRFPKLESETLTPNPQPLIPDLTLTRTGLAIGTAGYMSPEQIRGEKLDARTDLFSFGLVLYEMATGARAFAGETGAVVHEQILHRAPERPRELRPDLPAKLEAIIHRALERDREARYPSAAEIGADLVQLKTKADSHRRSPLPFGRLARRDAAAAVIALAVVAAIAYRYVRNRPALTDKDAVVVGDFTNTTGDSVFDDTLKQGLEVQLEQSPFFDLVSEKRVNETLKLMGRSPGERLTPEIAREVCQRTGGKAALAGLIAALGSQYVIGLEAVNCATGDVLAQAQEQATGKEAVLKALDHTALALRAKLGESHGTLQQYATSLEDATTPSLGALKAYSEARKIRETQGYTVALPYFQQAAQLDPNFAMAYANMAHAYQGLNQIGRSGENARKAYELRAKVSERERFYIEATYYLTGIGDLERARQLYEEYQQAYPRDPQPCQNLAFLYTVLGNPQKALEEQRQALRLDSTDESIYAGLAAKYMDLNRFGETKTVFRQAEERKLDTVGLLAARYELAFLRDDTSEMERLAAEARGKPGAEDIVLGMHGDTQAGYGRLRSARELWRQAEESARRNDAPERAAYLEARAAVFEAELGYEQQARAEAYAAVKQAYQQAVTCQAALVLARAGDTAKAEELAAEIDKTFPLDTQVQRGWLPVIRAAIALGHKDSGRAIDLTKQAMPSYDPLPAYVRGWAYLQQRDGTNAAAAFGETFQRIPVRPGSFQLARLGLARALALDAGIDVTPDLDPAAPAAPICRVPRNLPGARHDGRQSDTTAKALVAYEDFLTYWKDADADIPLLKQAKAEYALLHRAH